MKLAAVASALLVLFLVAACADCSGAPTQAQTAQAQNAAVAGAVASAANAALPVLAAAMEAEGDRVIERSESRVEAELGLQAVENRWAPVWEAWRLLVIAQDAYATGVEAGEDTAAHLANLKARYCDLRALWPAKIPGVPLGLVTCPAASATPGADAGPRVTDDAGALLDVETTPAYGPYDREGWAADKLAVTFADE